MRGCLILIVGMVVGAGAMALAWPSTPAGSTVPQGADVHVSLGNAYLTRIVQARLSSTGIVSIRGVQVRSAPPDLVVRANAGIGPFSAPISVELQPLVVGGDIQVRIIETQVGVVPIPSALTGLVTGSINGSLHHTLGTNAVVTGVTTTPRGLDITANYPYE
jgi:hypothetical protein